MSHVLLLYIVIEKATPTIATNITAAIIKSFAFLRLRPILFIYASSDLASSLRSFSAFSSSIIF